jgi:imidazole glycerol-phosphate synthase subunit HisF
MLRPRIIPCLLVHDKGLVKTVRFKEGKYVGDPINAVKIFNEKEVDELMVLAIDASRKKVAPDFTLIQRLAAECRMPLAYGGGVSSPDEARRIIGLGVEKVSLSAAAAADPALIGRIAQEVGSQSVVVVVDARKKLLGNRWEMFTHNGTVSSGRDPVEFAQEAQERGAGEIVINSIDRDGAMSGYDLALVERLRRVLTVPLTVLGGAGSLADIETLVREFGVIGAAAGSLFVFKGPYKAVLINYPDADDRDRIAALARSQ